MATYDETSLTLLGQVQARYPDAWERLVELYAPLIRHWCRQSQMTPDDTADIFQDVFRAVATHIGTFQRDRTGGTFRGWLRTITSNKIRDHLRRQKNKATAAGGTNAQQMLAEVADAVSLAEEDEERAILQQSVQRMLATIQGDFEPRTWQAFWKAQVEEQPTDQIATELTMTPAAVRKAKFRVLRRLREEFQDLLD